MVISKKDKKIVVTSKTYKKMMVTSKKEAMALAAASVLWLDARRLTSVTKSLAQAWKWQCWQACTSLAGFDGEICKYVA